MNSENALFTVETVAAKIAWHPESLRRAIRAGRVHAIKLGKTWRISQVEIDRITTQGLPV
jgi:excisionase family DNA binding protein